MNLNNKALSVKQLSDFLTEAFNNPIFQKIAVYGEIYSIKLGKFSYIEIGDQGNKQTNSPILKCAFSTYYNNDFHLEDYKPGDVIEVEGKLSYYSHGCSLTLWGNKITMLQSQLGKNLLQKRKTLEKLEKLGYLDEKRKRPIPVYCKKMAILTASNGAAYQDILKTLHQRFPMDTVLYPIVVQGDSAARSIVSAMEKANKGDYDVILLGRGGGSKTDLACFDDEKVAFSIAESRIPVITAIGHTIDTAIADRVSDKMAITPTEAASLINPSLEDIEAKQDNYKDSLKKEYCDHLDKHALNLEGYKRRLEELSPLGKLKEKSKALKEDCLKRDTFYKKILQLKKVEMEKESNQLNLKMELLLETYKGRKSKLTSLLETYNPENLKKKGYALLYKDGKKIESIKQLKKGDQITITYPDGRKEAEIL